MTIRRHEPATHEPAKCYELSGIPSDGTCDVLRLEFEDRIVSIPLGEVVRWQSARDGSKLVFHTSSDLVVISGINLGILHTAADEGRLRLLRTASRRPHGEVWIKLIEVQTNDRAKPTIS